MFPKVNVDTIKLIYLNLNNNRKLTEAFMMTNYKDFYVNPN